MALFVNGFNNPESAVSPEASCEDVATTTGSEESAASRRKLLHEPRSDQGWMRPTTAMLSRIREAPAVESPGRASHE